MRTGRSRVWLLLLCCMLAACAGKDVGNKEVSWGQSGQQTDELHGEQSALPRPLLAYDVTLDMTAAEHDPPPAKLMDALRAASLLIKLRDTPPDDLRGLTFRLDKDEAEARRLLQAFGYYDGTVTRHVRAPLTADTGAVPSSAQAEAPEFSENSGIPPKKDQESAARWQVGLTLTAGPLFRVQETAVRYAGQGEGVPVEAPASLKDVGLEVQGPAVSASLLQAVERVPAVLGQRGYPLSKVLEERYAVDKETQHFFATVLVDAGPRVRMGRVRMRGDSAVNPAYLEKLRTWKRGELWDQREVDKYRDLLTRQGLFRSVEMEPVPAVADAVSSTGTVTVENPSTHAQADAMTVPPPSAEKPASHETSPTPLYDLLVTVADAPARTVGGGLNYESDRGLGAQAYWEHRNMFGQGERFRTEASVWRDSQYLKSTLRKPAFLDRRQELIAEGWLRNEDTVAYTQRAAVANVALERRFGQSFVASAGFSVEGGDLEDAIRPRQGYFMAGVPVSVRYEGAGDLLDSVRGWRSSLTVKPSWGQYVKNFTVFPTRLNISAYLPFGRMTAVQDKEVYRVVLAARAAAGSLLRGDSQSIPAAARYYGGGGGSVRGYAYQSLGPRDRFDDPLGGASFAELSLEARIRVTEDIAVVPFLDGGNVFADITPGFLFGEGDKKFQWGAGIGLRYHTAIGPVRLDVATPLNPRTSDAPFFLYISIGQSF